MGKYTISKFGVLMGVLALVFGAFNSHAAEGIERFDSVMRFEANGDVHVEETLQVVAQWDKIKRGIYREFTLPAGALVYVDSVERNGIPEPYHVQSQGSRKRVYIGSKNKKVSVGVHTYTLRYTLKGFAQRDDKDTQWRLDVTGSKWDFPIDEVNLVVHGPANLAPDEFKAEVHAFVRQEKFPLEASLSDSLSYQHERQMKRGEGIRIVMTLPESEVALSAPSAFEQQLYAMSLSFGGTGQIRSGVELDKLSWIVVSAFVVILYFFGVWAWVGRDPLKGKVMPTEALPEELTPAMVRYMYNRGYDLKVFAVAMVNLAHLGVIKIKPRDNGYDLVDTLKGQLENKEYRIVRRSVVKNNSLATRLQAGTSGLRLLLDGICRGHYFSQNRIHWWIGIILLAVVLSLLIDVTTTGTAFLDLGIAVAGCGILSFSAILTIQAVYNLRRSRGAWLKRNKFITFLTVLSWIASIYVNMGFLFRTNMLLSAFIGFSALTVAIFYFLFPALTRTGRELMNAIEGYQLYLQDQIEKAKRNGLSPKQQATLLSEHLPYVIALELDGDWVGDLLSSLKNSMDTSEWKEYSHNSAFDLCLGYHNHCSYADFCLHLHKDSMPPPAPVSYNSNSSGSSDWGGGGGFGGFGGGGGGGGFSGGSGGGGW